MNSKCGIPRHSHHPIRQPVRDHLNPGDVPNNTPLSTGGVPVRSIAKLGKHL